MSVALSEALARRIGAEGSVPFVEFCRAALYDPVNGYYVGHRQRVGASHRADFVTNLSVRSVFAPLVLEALRSIAGSGLGEFAFWEIGAEPDTFLLADVAHPFRSVKVTRLGDERPEIDGPMIVFANEWLDAQPFVRLCFQGGRWRESMVSLDQSGKFIEFLDESICSGDAEQLVSLLPERMPEGYRLDLSLETERRLGNLLEGTWPGIFLTFDYGSSWDALIHHLPGGTARGYQKQSQSSDLLRSPGSQDLTCNVCWDRVAEVCRANGFEPFGAERQEAFLFRYAGDEIRRIVERGQDSDAAEQRAKLQQILNPAHFGAAFQVFWAKR